MAAATGVSPSSLLRLPSPHTPVSSSSALLQRRAPRPLLSLVAAPPRASFAAAAAADSSNGNGSYSGLRWTSEFPGSYRVSASYEQALMDARKQIEREMERFKVCEKETKTKAFSKEGLGQQPKTDPREKAKAETRDWLNSVLFIYIAVGQRQEDEDVDGDYNQEDEPTHCHADALWTMIWT
ncbi:general negative regulator of transcription subunit 3 [Hordeum vulgare]|nr:general negative regulator of transcription subunit 3 [Hordeum vulgare]